MGKVLWLRRLNDKRMSIGSMCRTANVSSQHLHLCRSSAIKVPCASVAPAEKYSCSDTSGRIDGHDDQSTSPRLLTTTPHTAIVPAATIIPKKKKKQPTKERTAASRSMCSRSKSKTTSLIAHRKIWGDDDDDYSSSLSSEDNFFTSMELPIGSWSSLSSNSEVPDRYHSLLKEVTRQVLVSRAISKRAPIIRHGKGTRIFAPTYSFSNQYIASKVNRSSRVARLADTLREDAGNFEASQDQQAIISRFLSQVMDDATAKVTAGHYNDHKQGSEIILLDRNSSDSDDSPPHPHHLHVRQTVPARRRQQPNPRRTNMIDLRPGENIVDKQADLQVRWQLREDKIEWCSGNDSTATSGCTPASHYRAISGRSLHAQKGRSMHPTVVGEPMRDRSGPVRRTTMKPKMVDEGYMLRGIGSEQRTVTNHRVPIVKQSRDPFVDFRDSMIRTICEGQMFMAPQLEELLQSFLTLNSPEHHETIIRAFIEVWEHIFEQKTQSITPRSLTTFNLTSPWQTSLSKE